VTIAVIAQLRHEPVTWRVVLACRVVHLPGDTFASEAIAFGGSALQVIAKKGLPFLAVLLVSRTLFIASTVARLAPEAFASVDVTAQGFALPLL
jgi:hypothetical protein